MPRGLGRGLGALIPTGPAATGPAGERDAVDRWLLGGSADSLTAPGPESVAEAHGAGADPGLPVGEVPPLGAVPRGTDDTAGDDPDAPPAPDRGPALRELPVDAISANPRQPRDVFDPDALAELVASIREVGLLQPVVVRPTAEPGAYQLVLGERRLRASRQAGLTTIPAIVRETDDRDLLRDALLENLHRADLNPLEEAAAYQQLLDDAGCSQEELSRRIGRSRPQISNTLRLLKLSPPVQRRVAAGVLSAGHARALVALAGAAAQEDLAGRIVAEGLSVRATEEIVSSGGTGAAPGRRATRVATVGSPEHDEVAQLLGDRLETRVTVSASRSRGRIVIDFATTEDLRRISAVIAGGTSGQD